jgi:hypothetical protein
MSSYCQYPHPSHPFIQHLWLSFLQVSREKHKRHLDRTAVLQFWAAVDKFAAAKKANLKY